jgi:acetyl-CoA carboxylase biotin carboxyl carrier protein
VSLTARDVAEILRVLEQSSFDTLDLELNGMQIHLRRGSAAPSAEGAPTANPAAAAPAAIAAPASPLARPQVRGDATAVPAPLLGTFYHAPRPGDAPFVQVGDRVESGTIIGIIEVMKLMNSVRAGVAGQVVEISAGNGELVEYGQALLWVRAD